MIVKTLEDLKAALQNCPMIKNVGELSGAFQVGFEGFSFATLENSYSILKGVDCMSLYTNGLLVTFDNADVIGNSVYLCDESSNTIATLI